MNDPLFSRMAAHRGPALEAPGLRLDWAGLRDRIEAESRAEESGGGDPVLSRFATRLAGRCVGLGPALEPPPEAAWAVATSGSTGAPKTALLNAAGVDFVASTVCRLLGLGPEDHILSPLPLEHSYGLSQLWLAAHAGCCLVRPASAFPGDLAAVARAGEVFAAVPATLRARLRAAPDRPPRLVTLAGQDLPLAERRAFAAAWPQTRFVLFYGLTEATSRVSWLPPERFTEDLTGLPLPGVDLRLVDGELQVRGPNVFWGYLGRPFTEAWLPTGDLFEARDGAYRFLGRRDGVFKRFGEKVVPEQVEAAMLGHPSVRAALVLPEPGPDGELAPVAWVEGEVATGEILRYLRARLPSAAVPARVERVAELPRGPSGKLLRRRP